MGGTHVTFVLSAILAHTVFANPRHRICSRGFGVLESNRGSPARLVGMSALEFDLDARQPSV